MKHSTLTTAVVACATTRQMSETLNSAQLKLAEEIRRLCTRVHGKEHVMGWEIALFRACLGKAMIAGVGYVDMARLLRYSLDAGGWIMRMEGQEKFLLREEWVRIVRANEGLDSKPEPDKVK